MRTGFVRFLLCTACALVPLLTGAQYTDATYSPGRCNGSVSMVAGDQVHFALDPTAGSQAVALWIFVRSGGGNTIISDGQALTSEGLFLNTGDMLLFETHPPFDLYFQGGLVTLAWGGAILGAPQAPVCGTGASGPIVLKVDQRYDARFQSAASGTAVQVVSYASVTAKTSGTLVYSQGTGPSLQGTFAVPQCSGSSCCAPVQAQFPVNAASGVAYTLYAVTPAPAVNVDYTLAAPTALAATASAAPLSGAPPLAVAFTGAAAGGIAPYTWDWDFGDGSAHKTVQNPSHTYQAGTFHPILTVKDSAGTTSKDTHLTVTAATPYTVAANATPAQGPAPLAVAFTATVSGGSSPFTFAWDFGDGGSSTEQNPSHTYPAIGAYHVSVTVSDSASATATDTHLTIQALGPGVLFASSQADRTFGKLPLTVSFTGAASGGTAPYTYSWNFGDGSAASSDQNPVHAYASVGSFPVTLTVADAKAQTATDGHLRIYVTSSFLVTASGVPTSGPLPLTVQFSETTSGGTAPYQYAWDFGDGATSTEASPSHTYTANGSYPVTLLVKDSLSQAAVDNSLLIAAGDTGVPTIASVSKLTDPFRLVVTGTGFKAGCTVLLGGTPAPVAAFKGATKVVAKGGEGLKALAPKGVPVCVRVRNPDGFTSACFTYTR